MSPNPIQTSLLSRVQLYIEILACDERGRHCPSCSMLRAALRMSFTFLFAHECSGYASLDCHWRRWCHLLTGLVTAQGVYCLSVVSYLKCHSQKHKRQDADPCTCGGAPKGFGPGHIITTDTTKRTQPLWRSTLVWHELKNSICPPPTWSSNLELIYGFYRQVATIWVWSCKQTRMWAQYEACVTGEG